MGQIREHVTTAVLRLNESLAIGPDTDGVARAKAALAKHVGKLVVTPGKRDGRPVYKVTATSPGAASVGAGVLLRDGGRGGRTSDQSLH